MHLFVPYNGSTHTRSAVIEACRMAEPGDTLFVMSAIMVPACYAVDVIPGMIWKQVCDAERHLRHAATLVSQISPPAVAVRFVCVQARDYAAAIIAGARHYEAWLILFGGGERWLGRLAACSRYGVVGRVTRDVSCGVRVVSASRTTERGGIFSLPVPFVQSLQDNHLPTRGV